MVDGKRSQEIEGAYKRDTIIHFYRGTILIGEDNRIFGRITIDSPESKSASLEGRIEKINNRNYLIFEIDLEYSKQFHILRKSDLSSDIIGKYSGQRYGINKIDSKELNSLTLDQIHYNNIPEILEEKTKGGTISYIGISENQYYWNKTKAKWKKFFGIK